MLCVPSLQTPACGSPPVPCVVPGCQLGIFTPSSSLLSLHPHFPRGSAKKRALGGASGRCQARPAGGGGGKAAAGGPEGGGCRVLMPALRGTLPWGFYILCPRKPPICFPLSAPFLLGLLSKPCDAMWDVMTQVQTQPAQSSYHLAPLGFSTLPLGSLP